jgi:hypothetical protein
VGAAVTEAKRGRMAKAIVNFMVVVWSELRDEMVVKDRTLEVDEEDSSLVPKSLYLFSSISIAEYSVVERLN